VTVTPAVTEPAAFVAVSVAVVVAGRATVREPEVPTVPMLGLIETDVAPVVLQVSVDDAPGAIEISEAVSVAVVGAAGDTVVTVTVAAAVTEPPAPVAVRCRVVAAGDASRPRYCHSSDRDTDRGGVTRRHVSVAATPATIGTGLRSMSPWAPRHPA
jgi:hypothetical protein